MNYYTVIVRLEGALSDAVALEWTNQAAPLDSGRGWEPCLRRADGTWRFASHDPLGAVQPHRRAPGAFGDLAIRYRLRADGPWSPAAASRKEIVILETGDGGDLDPIPPLLVTAPSLGGAAVIGSEVTLDPGLWSGYPAPQLAFQWRRDGVEIPGAAARVYAPGPEDDLTDLDCVVTARNAAGAVPAITAALRVRYPAPAVLGELPEKIFAEGAGPQAVETAFVFAGANLRFTATGAAIDARTGVVLVPTDDPVLGRLVTITATNSGGQANARLSYTVEAAPPVDVAPRPLRAGDVTIASSAVRGVHGGFTPLIRLNGVTPTEVAWTTSLAATPIWELGRLDGARVELLMTDPALRTNEPPPAGVDYAVFGTTPAEDARRDRLRLRYRTATEAAWSDPSPNFPVPLPPQTPDVEVTTWRPAIYRDRSEVRLAAPADTAALWPNSRYGGGGLQAGSCMYTTPFGDNVFIGDMNGLRLSRRIAPGGTPLWFYPAAYGLRGFQGTGVGVDPADRRIANVLTSAGWDATAAYSGGVFRSADDFESFELIQPFLNCKNDPREACNLISCFPRIGGDAATRKWRAIEWSETVYGGDNVCKFWFATGSGVDKTKTLGSPVTAAANQTFAVSGGVTGYRTSGVARIFREDGTGPVEWVDFTRSGATITLTGRGRWGSAAAAHGAGAVFAVSLWESRPLPAPFRHGGPKIRGLAQHPTEEATLWLFSAQGTWKTTNLGASWAQQWAGKAVDGNLISLWVDDDDAGVMLAARRGGTPGLYYTENGGAGVNGAGATWTLVKADANAAFAGVGARGLRTIGGVTHRDVRTIVFGPDREGNPNETPWVQDWQVEAGGRRQAPGDQNATSVQLNRWKRADFDLGGYTGDNPHKRQILGKLQLQYHSDPTDPNRWWTNGYGNPCYSTDRGRTWRHMDDGFTGQNALAMSVSAGEPDRVDLGVVDVSTLWTDDAFETTNKNTLTPADRAAIVRVAGGSIGVKGTLCRIPDVAGVTVAARRGRVIAAIGGSGDNMFLCTRLASQENFVSFLGRPNAAGGGGWKMCASGVDKDNPNTAYIGPFRTTDAGETFDYINANQARFLAQGEANHDLLYCLNDSGNSILRSLNRGASFDASPWLAIGNSAYEFSNLYATICPLDDVTVMIRSSNKRSVRMIRGNPGARIEFAYTMPDLSRGEANALSTIRSLAWCTKVRGRFYIGNNRTGVDPIWRGQLSPDFFLPLWSAGAKAVGARVLHPASNPRVYLNTVAGNAATPGGPGWTDQGPLPGVTWTNVTYNAPLTGRVFVHDYTGELFLSQNGQGIWILPPPEGLPEGAGLWRKQPRPIPRT